MDRTAPSHAAPGVRFLTVLVPVRSEAEHVRSLFTALRDAVHVPCEVLLVCDADDDPTLPEARRWASILPFPLRLVRNNLGPGPARALRAGFAAARGDAVVVVMADLSDDLPLIDRMVEEMSRGADLVVGSRYVSGGRQVGGPWLQRCLARTAGLSLHGLLGFPVHDATNSFRLYRTEMLRALTIQSDWGFEISLEITVKAWLRGWTVSELPAHWYDRTAGKSKFRFWRWLPRYLYWYAYAFASRAGAGPRRALRSLPR